MSESSKRIKASVFGALGPDDAYFSNRVQVAARDAQQRWPLLRELPTDAAAPADALEEDAEERWAPTPAPARARGQRSEPLRRTELGDQLAEGLERLAGRSSKSEDPQRQQAPRTPAHDTPAEVPDAPAAEMRRSAPERALPEVTSSAPAGTSSLQALFQKIAPAPSRGRTPGTEVRKSLLGRLGRR